MFIRFDVIHERDRRTDRRADARTLHDNIDRAYIASRGNNLYTRLWDAVASNCITRACDIVACCSCRLERSMSLMSDLNLSSNKHKLTKANDIYIHCVSKNQTGTINIT